MGQGPILRLLRPRHIAVIGGGVWCTNVVRECTKFGFEGQIWPVHPRHAEIAGRRAFARIEDLPEPPDAAFVGINRTATVAAVRALGAMGAGGAVCFASGFQEAQAELADGADLQAALVQAAGGMRLLGPNCYGFLNALDRVSLWPDQHGLVPVARGVALLAQSSNVVLNLTMQTRGLPIAYVATVGNQAQTDLAEVGMAMLEDPRVSALGLFVEGFRDVRAFEAMAARARDLGKRIVAMKLGASAQSAAAAVSHTASLTGSDGGARALLRRLGVARVSSLGALLETLKILHAVGPLASRRIASMSCSGGEASLMADSALAHDVAFPVLDPAQRAGLRAALGPRVALANPLDYHTYIWGDVAAMTACFSAMMQGDLALGLVVLDFPRADRCAAAEWDLVLDAIAATAEATGKPMAILASLPDTLPEAVAARCLARGILPLCDVPSALEAVAAAAWLGEAVDPVPVLRADPETLGQPHAGHGYLDQEEAQGVLTEAAAKEALARAGVPVPALRAVDTAQAAGQAAAALGFPVVLKGVGLAHKSEAGAVRLGLSSAADVVAAAHEIGGTAFLVEEMVGGGIAELLVGVTRDPVHGFVLTLGAGGVLAEVLDDTAAALLPVTGAEVRQMLARLRIAPVLRGYRGRDGVDMEAVVQAVLAVQDFVVADVARIEEVEINPLICRAQDAVAVDALIRLRKE